MNFNHKKYPIVVGRQYIRLRDKVIGELIACELFSNKNDANIEIKSIDDYCVYKMNYSTFTEWEMIEIKRYE